MSNPESRYNPEMVSRLVMMNDEWFGQYEGPFELARDGGHFEVTLPIIGGDDENEYLSIETFTNLSEHEDDRALVLNDRKAVDYGAVESFDIFEEEGYAVVRVDSVVWQSLKDLADVDVDVDFDDER